MTPGSMTAVAYRALRYIDECRKRGASASEAQALALSEASEAYFADSMESLADAGYVSGVRVDRYINGATAVTFDDARLTLSGAEFLEENSGMRKAAELLGPAYEAAVAAAVSQLLRSAGLL